MTVIKSETRELYITKAQSLAWKLMPQSKEMRTLLDPVDVIFRDLDTGIINMAAAAQRVRELIGAAEVASANEARRSWVDDEPTELFGDDDNRGNYDRCAYCGAWDGQCSH